MNQPRSSEPEGPRPHARTHTPSPLTHSPRTHTPARAQEAVFDNSVGIGCAGLVLSAREPYDILAVNDRVDRPPAPPVLPSSSPLWIQVVGMASLPAPLSHLTLHPAAHLTPSLTATPLTFPSPSR